MSSDCRGEYYKKYDESSQLVGPFANYLQECQIVAQLYDPWYTRATWCG